MVKRIVSTLLTALAVLALLSPQALAAGTEKGLDQVLVSADGTVTLVSGHAADEKVSSVQLQLEVESLEEGGQLSLSFTFGSLPQDILSSCSTGANTVSIYVAGTEALIPEGQTQLVLGTLSVTGANGPAMARVSLAELSLKYVYGTKLVPQAASGSATLNVSSDRLQSLSEEAAAVKPENYSNESYEALQSALKQAQKVLQSGSASAEELAAAYEALSAAMSGLQEKLEGEPTWETRQSLIQAIEEAETLREADYKSGFDKLTEALEAAKAVLNDPTKNEDDLQAAIAALATAKKGLVEKPAQGPGDPGSVPEGKPGPGENGTKPSPSPSPNLPTSPSPSPSTSPSPSVSPSPAVSGSPDAEAEAESGALPTAMPRPSAPAGAVHRTDADSSFVPWALALAACAVLAVLALFLWRRYRR